jgi:hypothetical protein
MHDYLFLSDLDLALDLTILIPLLGFLEKEKGGSFLEQLSSVIG